MINMRNRPGDDSRLAKPRLLLVEDDPALRQALETTLSLKAIAFESAPNAESAIARLREGNWCAVVSDIRLPAMSGLELLIQIRRELPDLPVVLMTAYADAQTAVKALKGGARDFLMKPFKPDQFLDVIRRYLPLDGEQIDQTEGPVAVDPVSKRVVQTLERVARTDASVLLLGESGVGKEVMAQLLHRRSQRQSEAFVAINCAAIPPTLLEATLFGHEKGAYTGASKGQQGKFELAQGGTIFLDEIAEMPPELQTKLLRVLQERQVERVGSHQTISLDVRLITATNQDLRKCVSTGMFREDLYYRINVFPIKIPPLRERKEDIIPLAERFLFKYRASMGQPEARLSVEAIECLRSYAWPGNVRELENTVQRALLLCDGALIRPQDLAIELSEVNPAAFSIAQKGQQTFAQHIEQHPFAQPSEVPYVESTEPEMSEPIDNVMGLGANDGVISNPNTTEPSTKCVDVRSMERQHILKVLDRVGGNRKRAVELLGISERTLRYKLKLWREEGFKIP